MKNSKQYAKVIGKLYRSLKKKHGKVKAVEFDDPVEAIVYAIISENVRSSKARSIRKRINEHFINLNDLRVSRTEEIAEVLGSDSAAARRTADRLTEVLNAIFHEFDKVGMEELKEMGKRQGHKELEKLHVAGQFVVDYCFLTALGGHAIPLTPRMIEYLKADDLVDPAATDEDITSFLERQISASSDYEFYSLLRRQSEASSKKFKPPAKPPAKAAAKVEAVAPEASAGKVDEKKSAAKKVKTKKKTVAKKKTATRKKTVTPKKK